MYAIPSVYFRSRIHRIGFHNLCTGRNETRLRGGGGNTLNSAEIRKIDRY